MDKQQELCSAALPGVAAYRRDKASATKSALLLCDRKTGLHKEAKSSHRTQGAEP